MQVNTKLEREWMHAGEVFLSAFMIMVFSVRLGAHIRVLCKVADAKRASTYIERQNTERKGFRI